MKQPRKISLFEKKILSKYLDDLSGWRVQRRDRDTIWYINIRTQQRLDIRY